MLIDSHCHLDRVSLAHYEGNFDSFIQATHASGVTHMLCVSIDLEQYPKMLSLVEPHEKIFLSVGVHPTEQGGEDPSVDRLIELSKHQKNIAIGETGLDFFHCEGDLDWQIGRFRKHIHAAGAVGKPLIIHTRDAGAETIRIMQDEQARKVGGVMHCFTESWEIAKSALDMGFYISFSGIVTFKNAAELREVARKVPLDRVLIETDSPYLAPVPYRGKPNEPKYVWKVAETMASIRGLDLDEICEITSNNFFRLFQGASQ